MTVIKDKSDNSHQHSSCLSPPGDPIVQGQTCRLKFIKRKSYKWIWC